MSRSLVFITGASSGIGQALALQFYRAGYSLALVARRISEMKSWADASQISVDRYTIYSADVANFDSIAQAAQACMAQQGLPDVVIANAAISLGVDTAERGDLDVMAKVLATNTMGVAATFHPFIKAMVQRGSGTFVGLASVAGIRGLPGHGAYCASKAAVISYCESLRGELRLAGVKVVTLCPGYVDTPLTRRNQFPMPFLMQPEAFARKAIRVIEAGKALSVIPWQMSLLATLLRWLPTAWFDKALEGRERKHRGL
jgi:short-subunit dehydrogenase